MADWYVSSAAWNAIPQFAASTAYTVGNIVRPLTAPAFANQYAFRCTVAGTSGTEPTWTNANANNNTLTTGGVTFANVSGQAAYGWGAAAGNFYSINNGGPSNRPLVGDRVFLSSDHLESNTINNVNYNVGNQGYGLIQIISVNRAGSVPPVAADVVPGATISSTTGVLTIDSGYTSTYWEGVRITTTGATGIYLASLGAKTSYFRNCAFYVNTATVTAKLMTQNPLRTVWDNTTVQFGATGHTILGTGTYPVDLVWINTPSAIQGAIIPTTLFSTTGTNFSNITLRGLDLSALNTTLYTGIAGNAGFAKVLLDSCRIVSGVVRYTNTYATNATAADEVELVNCYDGSNFIAERHTPAGDINTEFTITLNNGATDMVGTFSHRFVSSTRCDKYAMTLDGFWMDVNNLTIGGPRTASVEIVSSLTLNTDDIALIVEYEGTSGSSLAAFATSLPSALAAVTALPTSTATWNSQPATPVKQRLSVTFTPQTLGRLRAQVRLGRPSTTVYVNPQITVT